MVYGRESPHPGGMDQFAAHRTNVHALVFRDVSPVPSLGGELNGVAFRVFLQLVPVGPYARFYPIAILVACGDRHDIHLVLKANARGFGSDELGGAGRPPHFGFGGAPPRAAAAARAHTGSVLVLVLIAVVGHHDRFVVAVVVRMNPRLEGFLRWDHPTEGLAGGRTIGRGLVKHIVSHAHAPQDANAPVLGSRQRLRLELHLCGFGAVSSSVGRTGTVDSEATQQPRSNVFRGSSATSSAGCASPDASPVTRVAATSVVVVFVVNVNVVVAAVVVVVVNSRDHVGSGGWWRGHPCMSRFLRVLGLFHGRCRKRCNAGRRGCFGGSVGHCRGQSHLMDLFAYSVHASPDVFTLRRCWMWMGCNAQSARHLVVISRGTLRMVW
mmetsp:Transcript_4567/g.13149  ORF Transcript_4567/g.13149 Transcript_4567/m.13149 type:complete len:382 (-) Transcript_4567:3223-4368(-)